MPVLTTPRRITLYWLLLLLPTIAIGTVAVILLRREQSRLAERGALADEARRAAIATRARLVVENVELLVGEVETALLDAVAAEPASGVDGFLGRWEKSNPLVRTAFRATARGDLVRPNPRNAGEEGQGFVRRFAQIVGRTPPWSSSVQDRANAPVQQSGLYNEPAARQEVSKNVAQVQSARRDVQELLKTQNAYASAPTAPAASNAASELADADTVRANKRSGQPAAERTAGAVSSDGRMAVRNGIGVTDTVTMAPPLALSKDVVEHRGWIPAVVDGRMHVLGWVQPAGGADVRGVELELVALISKLGGTLPAELPAGEGYALRDNQQRVLHQAGTIPREGEPVIRVPLAVLPGWSVDAYWRAPGADSAEYTGWFAVGLLLVGIFLAAILTGGSLLLWQARQSEQEAAQKTSFVANVSHEFKTPLTTIRLYSELLEQGRVRDAAQGGEYLRTIGRETQRLARLVNNALDFSRLEQGRKKYAREKLDLAAELRRLLETHAPRVREAGLTLRSELPATAVETITDRDALEQIVLNLIDNACKYAADGGEVGVSLARTANSIAQIRVGDRGPGVPAEHRERIFEKFHRVDDALTAEKTGAGLGLSIARQLARGLGGDLRYQPRVGGGAEFILELP